MKMIGKGIVHDNSELRKLIAENPDLPIVVLVGEYAWSGEYGYECCTDVACCIDEILDCETPFDDEYVFSDRDDFEEQLADYLMTLPKAKNLTDKEFDKMVEAEVLKYVPYWRKVISIRANG